MDEFGSRDQMTTHYLLITMNSMQKKFYKVSDLCNSWIIPMARSNILKLIKNGELQKVWKLPKWENYIIAMNIWSKYNKNASWVIYSEDIDEWKKRARKNSILSDKTSYHGKSLYVP